MRQALCAHDCLHASVDTSMHLGWLAADVGAPGTIPSSSVIPGGGDCLGQDGLCIPKRVLGSRSMASWFPARLWDCASLGDKAGDAAWDAVSIPRGCDWCGAATGD